MTFQHIPFRTKGYGLRGVIKDQCQMGYALDGMVDRQYEKLTDIVQGNGLHHRWNDMKLASDDVLFHFLQFVKSNSRVWQGQWQYATKFDRPEYCHKAAANLGLKKDEYRCIDIAGGMQ